MPLCLSLSFFLKSFFFYLIWTYFKRQHQFCFILHCFEIGSVSTMVLPNKWLQNFWNTCCQLQWNINTSSILISYLYPQLVGVLRIENVFIVHQNWLAYIYIFHLLYRKSKSEHLHSDASHQYFLHIQHPCQLLNQCASFSQRSLMLLQKWCEQWKQLLEFLK